MRMSLPLSVTRRLEHPSALIDAHQTPCISAALPFHQMTAVSWATSLSSVVSFSSTSVDPPVAVYHTSVPVCVAATDVPKLGVVVSVMDHVPCSALMMRWRSGLEALGSAATPLGANIVRA